MKTFKLQLVVLIFQIILDGRVYGQINVKEFKLTDQVNNDNSIGNVYPNNKAPAGAIFVWIKTNCDSLGYASLKQKGNLPVLYKWFQRIGGDWTANDDSYPQDLFAKSDTSLVNKLDKQFKENGYVEWISWTKIDLTKGVWRLAIISTHQNTTLQKSRIKIY